MNAPMTHDVIVVGSGIVGTTLACALAKNGFRVALIDKHVGGNDRRVSALTLAAVRLLENLGVWSQVALTARHAIARMHVWEEENGHIDFTAAEIGTAYLGYVVPNAALALALQAYVHETPSIEVHAPLALTTIAVDAEGVSVDAQGTLLRAQLLVGADGAQSRVRALAKIGLRAHAYAQHGVVATVTTTRANRGTAWQRFLPSGPLALLPLADNTYSLVWSIADDATINRDDDGLFIAALRAALGAHFVQENLGEIVAVGPRAEFPLRAAHAERYADARIALIGDAAHVIHPLAGQGLNLGLLDAAALAQTLTVASTQQRDIGSERILRRYERWRKGDALAMLAFTHGMQRLFGMQNGGLKNLRNVGLQWMNRLLPVKRAMIRQAAGLTGELPALCRELAAELEHRR